MTVDSHTSKHISILVEPMIHGLLEGLTENGHGVIVDCTLGGGGHTLALLEALSKDLKYQHYQVFSVDQDQTAIRHAEINLKTWIEQKKLTLIHSAFGDLKLKEQTSLPIVGLMADLGFSSDQLEDPDRGISFLREGPLDMRLNQLSDQPTCFELLLNSTEDELKRWIFDYGEDRFAKTIAYKIHTAIRQKALKNSTTALAEMIFYSVPRSHRYGRIHPATRTFQALRIVVNQELEQLEKLLNHVILDLEEGARVAILSFHSLEDRLVKQVFKSQYFKALTKKPVEADENEVKLNPRARSAKLRIAQKVSL
jgi:16S rRNA (cytosine1402-N4)-methyltransferase